jgi:hypothetical protein
MYFTLAIVILIVVLWMAYSDSCGMVRDKANQVMGWNKPVAPAVAAEPPKSGFSAESAPLADNLEALVESGDYAAATQSMGLEQNVIDSHTKFANEISKKTSAASKFTARDDPQDIVPWVGIFRRPRYDVARPLEDARSTSSADVSQLYVREQPFVFF